MVCRVWNLAWIRSSWARRRGNTCSRGSPAPCRPRRRRSCSLRILKRKSSLSFPLQPPPGRPRREGRRRPLDGRPRRALRPLAQPQGPRLRRRLAARRRQRRHRRHDRPVPRRRGPEGQAVREAVGPLHRLVPRPLRRVRLAGLGVRRRRRRLGGLRPRRPGRPGRGPAQGRPRPGRHRLSF